MTLDYRQLDWKLIGVVLLLSLIGIITILSAQHDAASDYQRTYYQRQLIWLAIALLVFAVVVHLPLRLFYAGAYLFYGLAIGLLLLVLLVGATRMGATRWFSFGPINLAPSDIAKVAVLLALARFFAYTKLPPSSKRRLGISFFAVAVPVLLILKQPDFGTSLVFWVLLTSMWFWSGLSPIYLLLMLSPIASMITAAHWLTWTIYFIVLLAFLFLARPGLIFGVFTVVVNLATGIFNPILWGLLREYQRNRILTFLDPDRDPRGAGYQIIQSKIAIGSGGIWGKGFQGGSQTRLEFLPERHTDFVFSVLAEEFGLWGAALVVLLFGYIFYRAIRIATKCRSRFASNLAAAAASILIFQFFVNIGMALGFMPVTGLALPFLSYGGTSLVLSWTLVGFIVLAGCHWQEY
ncbi:MAG: rod shape-determining protein RodA [bacterium]